MDWEDPVEKRMAIHCSISAWRILWTEEPGMEEEVTTVYEVTKSQT